MMRRLLLQENTDCMRVYDRNLEELPVSVELFGKYARITDYSEDGLPIELEEFVKDIVRRMCYIQSEDVVFHRRHKRSGGEQHELQSDKSVSLEIKEASHRFKVDLTKRIDTGLFLDHYKTRKLVESISFDLRVLNLFSYTGSFSVYAAAGNAALVESVDLSKTYTRWAEHNLLINGYEGDKYPCITEDALKYIIDSARNKKTYDLIIFDPPSFSNSRKMDQDFDVQRDYTKYFRFINNLLSNDGKVIFSTNLTSFHMDPGRIKGFEVKNITNDILADGFTKKKGISRTWVLEKVGKVKLTKEDYEGKKYFTVRDADNKIIRKKRMDDIQKESENNFEQIITDLENNYKPSNDNFKENYDEEEKEETVEVVNADYKDAIENIDANLELAKKADENTEENLELADEADENLEETSKCEDTDSETATDDSEETDSETVLDESEETISEPVAEENVKTNLEAAEEMDELVISWDDAPIASAEDSIEPTTKKEDRQDFSRDQRPSRDRRPSGDRDSRDRKPSGDRERRPYAERDSSYSRDSRERKPFGDRDRRPSGDRDRSFSRDSRDSRPSGDRPYSRDGGDRKPFGDRDRRPSGDRDRSFSRDGGDRKPFGDRDRKPSGDRDSRPSRDDNRVKSSKPTPYGFEKKNKARDDNNY